MYKISQMGHIGGWTMKSKFWIKLWHETLDDDKVGMLSDKLFRRLIQCFLLAGIEDRGGFLPNLSRIAWRMHIPSDEVQSDLVELQSNGFLDFVDDRWYVKNFSKRQANIDSSKRMQAFRDRMRSKQYNNIDANNGDDIVT